MFALYFRVECRKKRCFYFILTFIISYAIIEIKIYNLTNSKSYLKKENPMPLSPIIDRPLDLFISLASRVQMPVMGPDGRPTFDANEKMVMMNIATETELGAIKALTGYAKREGVLGMVATVLHRIWNAVKAIFGQSDWQRAENAVLSLSQRVLPFFALQANRDDKTFLEVMKVMFENPDFNKKIISLVFELGIVAVNGLNKGLQPFEAKLVPIIDKFIGVLKIDELANDIMEIKELLSDLPEDNGVIDNIVQIAELLSENGYIEKADLEELLTFLKTPEATLDGEMPIFDQEALKPIFLSVAKALLHSFKLDAFRKDFGIPDSESSESSENEEDNYLQRNNFEGERRDYPERNIPREYRSVQEHGEGRTTEERYYSNPDQGFTFESRSKTYHNPNYPTVDIRI